MGNKQESKFYYDVLNRRIRELLKIKKISTKEFAEKLKVSTEAVRLWIGGYSRPDISKIIEISNIFNVSTDYLLIDKGSSSFEYTEQMTSKKFSLSDKAMKKLALLTNNRNLLTNDLQLKIVNYIIENDTFLPELSINLLDFYKSNDNKLSTDAETIKNYNYSRYALKVLFEKFIDDSYKDLYKEKQLKPTYLFNKPKNKKENK